jgi:hypothetical protein
MEQQSTSVQRGGLGAFTGRSSRRTLPEGLRSTPEGAPVLNGRNNGQEIAESSANSADVTSTDTSRRPAGRLDWYIRQLCHEDLSLSPAGLTGIVLTAAAMGFAMSAWSGIKR